MKDIFKENNSSYDLRFGNGFKRGSAGTVKCGPGCLSFRGARLCQNLPPEIKNCPSSALSLIRSFFFIFIVVLLFLICS